VDVILRRRRMPEDVAEAWRAFEAVIPALERARTALTTSVPSTRMPGRPLAETLLEFEESLAEVGAAMASWRIAAVEREWIRASDALGEALGLADRVRTGAEPPRGFEGLIGLIGELLAPLDAFNEAAERFRDLRRGR
jgi:hypothetical protein